MDDDREAGIPCHSCSDGRMFLVAITPGDEKPFYFGSDPDKPNRLYVYECAVCGARIVATGELGKQAGEF